MLPDLVPIGLATLMLGTINESDGVQEHQFWLRNDGAEAVVLQQGYASCHCTTIDFEQGATVAPGDSTCVILRFNPQGKGGEFYESGTVKYGPISNPDGPTSNPSRPTPVPSLRGRGADTTTATDSLKGETNLSLNDEVTSPLPRREGQGVGPSGVAPCGSVTVAFEGTCVTSEETLLKQYPVQLNDHLSLSRNRFDFGIMAPGSQRTVYVTVLHWDEERRKETLPVTFIADSEKAEKSGGVSHIPVTLTTLDGGKPFEFAVTIDVVVK